MKILLAAVTLFVTLLTATPPSLAQTASPADAAWAGYFASLKSAVNKHDKTALKALIASRIDYEDGTVSNIRFLEDFVSSDSSLVKAVNTGKISGAGTKRLLTSEAGEIEFIFVKGRWYLKAFNVGG